MIDLGQLRSFAEVAERGTVLAAAAARGFTAPAVSQHISKLEAELDTTLFDRVGRRLRLTDSGLALLPVALEMLDLESQGRQVAKRRVSVPHLVIAGFASAIAALIVPRLAQIAGHMTLEIVEAEDAAAMRDLSLGAVDVVLTQHYSSAEHVHDTRFSYTPLVSDRLRLVVADDFTPAVTIDQLADAAWLVNGYGTRCEAATLDVLRANAIDPCVVGAVADNETLLALVAAGHGVTAIPALVLQDHRARVVVADQDLGVTRTIFAVTRAATADTTRPLVDLLRDGET